MSTKITMRGFTIVELLIVIVVVAILATITIVSYNGIQARANASAVTSGVKSIEKALRMYAITTGWTTWPQDHLIVTGYSNLSIQTMVDNLSGFDAYMQQSPTTSNLPASSWTYDYDGDIKPACGNRGYGTNIIVAGVAREVADGIDASIDDGDNNCGIVRYNNTNSSLYYSLSYTGDI